MIFPIIISNLFCIGIKTEKEPSNEETPNNKDLTRSLDEQINEISNISNPNNLKFILLIVSRLAIGFGCGGEIEKKYLHITDGDKIHYIDKVTNKIMYTFPYTVSERKIGNGLRINDNGKPGKNPFGRIIIKNKKVYKDED